MVFGRIFDDVGDPARGPRSKTGFESQVERVSGADVIEHIVRDAALPARYRKESPWRDQTFSSLKP